VWLGCCQPNHGAGAPTAQGNFSHSLAEWALTACLAFAKDLPRLRAAKAASKWEPFAVEELRCALAPAHACFMQCVRAALLQWRIRACAGLQVPV